LIPEVEAKLGSMDPEVIKQAHAGLGAVAGVTDTTQVTGK
jgi:hypothetical protein